MEQDETAGVIDHELGGGAEAAAVASVEPTGMRAVSTSELGAESIGAITAEEKADLAAFPPCDTAIGWYEDPRDSQRARYWGGRSWSGRTAELREPVIVPRPVPVDYNAVRAQALHVTQQQFSWQYGAGIVQRRTYWQRYRRRWIRTACVLVVISCLRVALVADYRGGRLLLGVVTGLISGSVWNLLIAAFPERGRRTARTTLTPAYVPAAAPVSVSAAVQSTPPAAWYPDPGGAAALRYWDGTAWTEHLHPNA